MENGCFSFLLLPKTGNKHLSIGIYTDLFGRFFTGFVLQHSTNCCQNKEHFLENMTNLWYNYIGDGIMPYKDVLWQSIVKKRRCGLVHNIWNYNYIQQQAQQLHHQSQVFQVLETARKLQEFLDSADKIEDVYKQAMTVECCAVLLNYAKKHGLL